MLIRKLGIKSFMKKRATIAIYLIKLIVNKDFFVAFTL